jgi:hypothetical protein
MPIVPLREAAVKLWPWQRGRYRRVGAASGLSFARNGIEVLAWPWI